MCGEFETKKVESDKWLGQVMSANGLADSVTKTIEAKKPKIKAACIEIIQIIQDWRVQVVGGMDSALLMWEACCVPSLLTGAGTWVGITPAAERRLEALQHWFLRLVLRVGPGCPTPSLRWETGVLSMRMRVWIEKLMLVRHLKNLDTTSLARKIYEEQKANNWPGLVKETTLICQKLNIANINEDNVCNMSAKSYRKHITLKCREKDENELRASADGKIKCEKVFSEKYGKKQYLSENLLCNVRKMFHTRVKMQPFAGNYPKDKRFMKTNGLCRCMLHKEEETHLTKGQCTVYEDLRANYTDLEDDKQLTKFFSAVLERRSRLEDKDAEDRQRPGGGDTTDSS